MGYANTHHGTINERKSMVYRSFVWGKTWVILEKQLYMTYFKNI